MAKSTSIIITVANDRGSIQFGLSGLDTSLYIPLKKALETEIFKQITTQAQITAFIRDAEYRHPNRESIQEFDSDLLLPLKRAIEQELLYRATKTELNENLTPELF